MKTKTVLLVLLAALLAACSSSSPVESSSTEGRFSVIAPAALKEQPQTIDTSSGKTGSHTFLVEKNNITYVVAYTDFLAEIVTSGDPQYMLSNARDTMVSSIQGTLTTETNITLNKFPGRDMTVAIIMPDGLGGIMRAHIYLVGNRLYQVMVWTHKADAKDPSVARFLDSFKLISSQ
jgi:hypothetical protein